jgi:hypothetical protein
MRENGKNAKLEKLAIGEEWKKCEKWKKNSQKNPQFFLYPQDDWEKILGKPITGPEAMKEYRETLDAREREVLKAKIR